MSHQPLHRKPTRISRRTKIMAFLATIAAIVLGYGLTASGATTTSVNNAGLQPDGSYLLCSRNMSTNLHYTQTPNNGVTTCPAGYADMRLAAAPNSMIGTTSVSAWPESSGWATDAFTRSLTVTEAGVADPSNCDGAPRCFLFTFGLVDNGSFVTVDGKPTPNTSLGGTISGVSSGTFQGSAIGKFYADTDNLAGHIPATATGSAKPATTSTWFKLAFGSGTHFFHAALTQYGWTYADTQTCEQWVDAVNPGDDGQSAGDGNITGTVHCTTA